MTTHQARYATYAYASGGRAATAHYPGAKVNCYVLQGVAETFINTPLPTNLAGRQVLNAYLEVAMAYDGGVGSRTTTLQRHARHQGYSSLTWNNRPGALAGSDPITITQAIATQRRRFDVTDDLIDIANGGEFYGWRLSTTYTSHSWGVYGTDSVIPPVLVVELADFPSVPNGVGPNGITALGAPVVTWQTPPGLVSAQVQVAAVDAAWTPAGGFTSPTFDTGAVSTTVGEVDLDDEGWSGMANGASVDVTVRQSTVLGTSAWSDPVTMTRENLATLTITAPGSSTSDPTPSVVWTLADQVRWQVNYWTGGKILYTTGVRAGDDSAFTPPVGATRSGQVLEIEVRGWTATERTPSPGDPGYSVDTQVTTYTPGAIDGVTGLSVNQLGTGPGARISMSRAALPDEWLIIRSDTESARIIARIPGVADGEPVWTYDDWTCPPNSDVTYEVRAIEAGVAGLSTMSVPFRSQVTGAWLFEPVTGGAYFRCRGTDLTIAYAESTVWYDVAGAPAPVKRTFGMRGFEGSIGGKLEDTDGRTLAEQMADFYAIKSNPSKAFRCAFDDVNIPVLVGDLNPNPHTALSTYKRVEKVVSYTIRQNGELPFTPVEL